MSRRRPRNPWAICTAAVGRKDKAKYERCVKAVKRKIHLPNSSISKVWNTLRMAQKYHVLRAAGVDKDRADANAVVDWSDLAPDIKGMLLAGWNMGAIGGTTRRYRKGETTRRMPVLTNPEDGWRVTHDGETLKIFGKGTKGANDAFAWLHKHQGQSVDWAIRYSGYDIVNVEGGKVVFSRKRSGMSGGVTNNPVAKPFAVEGSHTYAVSFKGGGWHIYETYKTYDDAMDWAKYIMKEGIPGVRGNVQALVLRPTGQRSYSVYWRNARRVASNPVPIWMKSDEMFHRVVGVSIKEWQRIFRALPEWKKKEFHRRAGKKILSANAMKWVVEQGAPASMQNSGTKELPIEANRDQMARTVKFLRKRGVPARMVEVERGRFRIRVRASADEEKLLALIATGPWALDPETEIATDRQLKKWHASIRRHGGTYKPGQYEYGLRSRRIQMRSRRNKGTKIYYVAMYRPPYPAVGKLWAVTESMDSLPASVIGKVAVVQAASKVAALREARSLKRRLGV